MNKEQVDADHIYLQIFIISFMAKICYQIDLFGWFDPVKANIVTELLSLSGERATFWIWEGVLTIDKREVLLTKNSGSHLGRLREEI